MTVAAQLKQAIVTLKGTQATMRIYEQHSHNDETRRAFGDALAKVCEIVVDLEARQRVIEFEEPQYKGS